MVDFNVHLCVWGDLELCRGALDSIPGDVPVSVFDGRYASFDGETVLTPGLDRLCDDYPAVEYRAPPRDRLPFGHAFDVPDHFRPGVHAKARWMIEECLPQDEWTVKMDADDRLTEIHRDRLATLDDHVKAPGDVEIVGDRAVYPTRVIQPQYWTPWINDCFVPRDEVPRSASLAERYEAWQTRALRFKHYQQDPPVVAFENVGITDRSADYLKRRIAHLKRIGRQGRARDLDAQLQ